MTFDGEGHCVKTIEVVGGTTTSTIQSIWCSSDRCEERDSIGTLSKQFFSNGQQNASTSLLYLTDHLGSIREMTDTGGNIQAQYSYDVFGRSVKLQGGLLADFQFAGYYMHLPSFLNLTVYRAYKSGLGRWISRDPFEGMGGVHFYSYVNNMPIGYVDPLGLEPGLYWPPNVPKNPSLPNHLAQPISDWCEWYSEPSHWPDPINRAIAAHGRLRLLGIPAQLGNPFIGIPMNGWPMAPGVISRPNERPWCKPCDDKKSPKSPKSTPYFNELGVPRSSPFPTNPPFPHVITTTGSTS